MEAAFGRLHNGGRAAFGSPPTIVETIMGDGEAANITNTYKCVSNMCVFVYLTIFLYSPCVAPGALIFWPKGAPVGPWTARTGLTFSTTLFSGPKEAPVGESTARARLILCQDLR